MMFVSTEMFIMYSEMTIIGHYLYSQIYCHNLCHYLYSRKYCPFGLPLTYKSDIYIFLTLGMSLNTNCDPCARIGENSPATKWCVDCEDALCIACVKAYKGGKASMGHHVIDIDAISTLPGEVLTTEAKCSKHPDFIMDFFCNQHHVICCRNCMSEEHRSCDQVMPLEMSSNNARTSSLFNDISEGMKQVHLTLKRTVQNRQQNRDRMKIDEKTIVKQISAFKESIIKKLDELEHSTLLEMQTVSHGSISQMEREDSELEKSVSLIEKYLQQLYFLTKNGSNQHVFLHLHRLLPILSKEENNLEEIVANISDVRLVYDQPKKMFSGITHLGTNCDKVKERTVYNSI